MYILVKCVIHRWQGYSDAVKGRLRLSSCFSTLICKLNLSFALLQANKQIKVSDWQFSFTFDPDYVITIKLSINDNVLSLLTN